MKKSGNYKIGIFFDWIELFLYCLSSIFGIKLNIKWLNFDEFWTFANYWPGKIVKKYVFIKFQRSLPIFFIGSCIVCKKCGYTLWSSGEVNCSRNHTNLPCHPTINELFEWKVWDLKFVHGKIANARCLDQRHRTFRCSGKVQVSYRQSAAYNLF